MKMKQLTIAAILAMSAAACGSDGGDPPSLSVDVFGFGPDFTGGESFVPGMPNYEDSQTVLLSVTQPNERRVLSEDDYISGSGKGTLEGVSFGENLRLEMTVLDSTAQPIASGSTAIFDFDVDADRLAQRLQIGAVDSFTPIGSVVVDETTGERIFAESRLDYRGTPGNQWLGRIGHGAATTLDGRVLVVGGGDPVPGAAAVAFPEFRTVNRDIQVFDPETGYFTNIAFEDASGNLNEGDMLMDSLVFPTVTPLGDDRFLVTGGFTLRAETLRPVNTISLIDLRQPHGARVSLLSSGGNQVVLGVARGKHQAAYRASDQTVLVSGGIGLGGDDDYLNTFEIISLENGRVGDAPMIMQEARVDHQMTALGDGGIWITGGRNAQGVLKTTEVITGMGSAKSDDLKEPRFGHVAIRIAPGPGNLLMVVGGYSGIAEETAATFEIGRQGSGFNGWAMLNGRGFPSVAELPITKDIVVAGGRDANGDVLDAERLVFADLAANPPYTTRSAGTMVDARYQATASVASSGKVILVGGIGIAEGNVAAQDRALLYNAEDPINP